jgi:hypothetical protein
VAGLICALWKLEPALTVADIRTLITGANYTVNTAGGTQARIDAFAATMGIDIVRGNRAMQTAPVDVDDGSLLDGNARIDRDDEDGDRNTTEDYDAANVPGIVDAINRADRLRGDGTINMKDFRVFRDVLLQVLVEEGLLAPAVVSLDGPATHFKKDLNFDGCVFRPGSAGPAPAAPAHPAGTVPPPTAGCADAPREGVHARYDFNGSGLIDPAGKFALPAPAGVAPFKIDPDISCSGLYSAGDGGCWRDLDVLADPAMWTGEMDEEHVTVSRTTNSLTNVCRVGEGWSGRPSLLYDRDRDATGRSDGVVDYLLSADLHFIIGPHANPDYDVVEVYVFDREPELQFFRCIQLAMPRAGAIRTILAVPLWAWTGRTVRVRVSTRDTDIEPEPRRRSKARRP